MVAAPTISTRIASPYGWRKRGNRWDFHSGIDIAVPEGSPVYAVLPGRVVDTWKPGQMNLYGNTIVIAHAPQLFSLYAHLRTIRTRKSADVAAGEDIATVGRTAGTRADPDRLTKRPHLHFEFLDRWPPKGLDLNRIDPVLVFARLAAESTPEPEPPSWQQPPPQPRQSSAEAAILLALLFLALS